MHEEGWHFFAAARSDDGEYTDPPEVLLKEVSAAAFAAAAAAATRIARAYGSDDATLRGYVKVANAIEESLPPELHALWRFHFIDGHSLAEHAAGTGRDVAAARADYRNLVRALLAKPRETSAMSEIGAKAGAEIRDTASP